MKLFRELQVISELNSYLYPNESKYSFLIGLGNNEAAYIHTEIDFIVVF